MQPYATAGKVLSKNFAGVLQEVIDQRNWKAGLPVSIRLRCVRLKRRRVKAQWTRVDRLFCWRGLGCGCFGSTFRPKPGWLECLQKLQDNIMLNNKLSQLSRG